MRNRQQDSGFSLIELLISVTVMLVISAVALSALTYSQRQYGSEQLKADIHASLRGTFEVIVQEIGQAGSLGFASNSLSAGVTGSNSAQTVNVSSSDNILVGEQLTVGTGSTQETVQVTAIPSSTQITGIFRKSQANGTPVVAQGVFPQGVLSSSTATSLKLFGDINADGSLVYVEYNCNTAAGTLTRSITRIAPGVTTQNASQILLDNLVANPGGTPCFQYANAVNVTANSTTYTFIPSVAVSLTLQSTTTDPQTGAFATMTKSFSNLAPRSVIAGLTMAQASPPVTTRLQSTPAGLPLNAP